MKRHFVFTQILLASPASGVLRTKNHTWMWHTHGWQNQSSGILMTLTNWIWHYRWVILFFNFKKTLFIKKNVVKFLNFWQNMAENWCDWYMYGWLVLTRTRSEYTPWPASWIFYVVVSFILLFTLRKKRLSSSWNVAVLFFIAVLLVLFCFLFSLLFCFVLFFCLFLVVLGAVQVTTFAFIYSGENAKHTFVEADLPFLPPSFDLRDSP